MHKTPPTFQDPGVADDGYRVFQRLFLRALLAAAGGVSALFVLADLMGINHLGQTQLLGTVVYCLANLVMLSLTWRRSLYVPLAAILVLASFAIYTLALVSVPGDELRIVWYFLGIGGSYILLGRRVGLAFTVASIAVILALNPGLPIPYSRLSEVTITLALVSCSIISFAVTAYAQGVYRQLLEANRHLHALSLVDPLTGLPNRRLLDDRLRQTLAEGGRHPQQTFGALMFLDLDHFKEVNDSLGHQRGDALLIEIARRLREQVRDSDTVARLGGDEFVVLLPLFAPDREAALEGANTVAGKLLEAVGRPYTIDGHVVARSPSIGLTVFPEPGDTAAAVLQRADAAMYQAKADGRRCLRVSARPQGAVPAAGGGLADA